MSLLVGVPAVPPAAVLGKENGNVSLPETPVDNQEIEKDSDNVAFLDNEEEVEEEEQLSGDDGGGSKVTVQ